MKNPILIAIPVALFCLFVFPARAKTFHAYSGGIGNDSIFSPQTICYNTTPTALTGSIPTGGNGIYTYKWQYSVTSATTGYTTITGATAQGYAPGALTATRWYRRIVTSGAAIDTTPTIQITVTPQISHASNTIAAAQTICYNTIPVSLTGATPTGGNGIYSYAWQSSADNSTWSSLPADTNIGYSPPAQSATAWFRRIVYSGACSDNSASVKITVSSPIANNIAKTDQSVCNAQTPLALTGTTPTGGTGSGSYTYLWQSSTLSATGGFGTATGTSNGINYSPAALTQTSWFRRVVSSGGCTDSSAPVTVSVFNSAPGDPTVYGNNTWNVYTYSDNTLTSYAGYYTEPSLSFNTASRYTTAQSPSYASGYQGCRVATTYFSASMKRTNFTPDAYQLDLVNVDDNMTLLVNGVQVYTKNGGSATNIWTGYLGATDQVEIRWVQNTGSSQLAVNFTAVTPTPFLAGSVGSNQSVCYGDAPAAGFTNTASPSGGCTISGYQWQSSVDSLTWTNIAGATAATYTVSTAMTQTTWYRRVSTDACSNTAATAPVKITVNVIAPGDPSVFGDGVWNCYAYTYTAGSTAFSAATYKGYYTESSLSFNSTSRWPSGGSPSVASGYQGCYVTPTYNWVVYKRTNFTAATYQIDIPSHDDWVYLYINGSLVFQHVSCCDAHTNVWTGPLGAADQVEMRVLQGTSGSNGSITLTAVTPSPLTAGTITPSQTVCVGNNPPTPMTQATTPTGGCTIQGYQWQSSTDNGSSWADISGAVASSYTIPGSVYTQTLYRRIVKDLCGNSAASLPDTVYMNNSAPGDPSVFGNNTWNVYCYQDVNYGIYAGYYTEPNLTFNTTSRYSSSLPPSAASGYQGCQLINTYYSVSMKRTGFTSGIYQIDVTADDDYTSVYVNGILVSSLTYPAVQNNVWTGSLGPSDQVEIRWRNNAGPGQTGIRFTTVTPTALTAGSIAAYNPNLCTGDVPIIKNTTLASGGCYVNYSWQSSTDGGITWTTIAGATDTAYTASTSPTVPTQFRRVATDICGNTAYSAAVSFTPGGGAVGNPSVYGNGVWNVYVYSANGTPFSSAIYMGYYTEPLLSFNSTSRWSSTGSPSNASGYQGCQVSADNHWVSYRRTNFTAGTYQIDIPYHDDDVYLFINGTQVFTHTGCCDAHVNAWTGTLGASDQVELRWREFNGGSSAALNMTSVSVSTTLTAGTINGDQTLCTNSSPSILGNTDSAHSACYIGYQWQARTNCTGAWTDISGANAITYTPSTPATTTCYRRAATNACGQTAVSNTVTISLYSTTLTPGNIAANQTICSGAVPVSLASTGLPTGGDGNYLYQWQSSTDGTVWTSITGATAAGYSPPALTATTMYRRNVTACSGALQAVSASITITVNQPPAITTQPANASACPNGNTSITVTATGTALAYQWQVNTGSSWSNITNNSTYAGATTATLSITTATTGMNGYQYRVLVSGSCTPALTSNAVTLTIGTTPSISAQPAALTACAGSTTGFSVTASGSGLTYQWQQKIGTGSWTNLSDAGVYSGTSTASLTLTAITAGMSGYQYQCILTSSCAGTITSSAATLTVVAAINNTIASDQTICSGLTANNISGTSSSAYTYQWQTSTVSGSTGFVNASGTSNAYNYLVNPVNATTWYRRVVSNTGCSSTSNTIAITVNATPLTITSQPADQTICAGATATYSVTASGPGTLSYQWYEYNGSAWTTLTNTGIYSGVTTATLTLTGPGTSMNAYRYRVYVYGSGCTNSVVLSNAPFLYTNSYPVITYSNPDITACTGNAVTVNCTATGVGLTYQWQQNTGSGWNNLSNYGIYANVTTNSLHILTATASLDGSQYRCVVSGTCAPGTATSGTTNLAVNSPIANNSVSSSQTLCAGTPQAFTVSNPTGGTGSYTYQWLQNTGSGYTTITGATSVNYSPGPVSQTTQYIRTVSSGSCTANNSIAVTMTITPATVISTNPSDTSVCAGTNAAFSVSATGTTPAYQWQVNTGSGSFSNIANNAQYSGTTTTTLTILAPSTTLNGYQYRCVVTGNCAPASVTSNAATVLIRPTATITTQPANSSSCDGSTVSFQVQATGSALTYQWMEKTGSGSFTAITDGGIYSGSQSAALTLTGITTAMNNRQYLCVVTAGSCPVNTQTATLTVNTQPNLTITNPPAVCAPGTVNITAATVTTGSNLTWWKDAAATITLTNPSAVATSGTYYIRSATSLQCIDIKPVLVTINPIPTLSIHDPAPVCSPATIDLTAMAVTAGSTTGLSFTYYSDAAGTIALSNPAAIASSGTFYIRGTSAGGCSAIASVTTTINTPPTALVSYPGSPYCATGNASPTITGITGGTFSSTAGLSIDATTGSIDLASSTAGTYTVTYQFTNGTCGNTTSTSITVLALPTASISYAASPYCATGSATVTLTGTTGGTFSSTTGLSIDATTGTIDLPSSTPGTYTVTYQFTDGACSNSTSTGITINALPTASISYTASPYCATGSATVTLTGTTGGTFSSTTGLAIDAGTGTIDLAASAAGTYTVTLSFSDGTCSNTTSTSITILALPTASISYAGSPYCTTGNATVSITGTTGGSFSSTTGLTIDAATGTIDLPSSTPGTYTVTYQFTDGTCGNTTSTSLTIRQPILQLNDPAAVCLPATIDLTATGISAGSDPGMGFSYYTDAAGANTLATPAAVTASGTYYIRGTITATGCLTDIEPIQVTIHTPPVLTVSGTTDVCKGSPDTLIANATGSTISWMEGQAGTPVLATGTTAIMTPMATTQYTAIAVNSDGCSDTASIAVQVKPFGLKLTANPDPILSGSTVTLTTTASFPFETLQWWPIGEFPDQTASSQTVIVRDTIHAFYVIAQSTQGCMDTARVDVDVDVNLKDFFIPNAFTPNHDGKNDVFKIYGSSIRRVELRVFNQWGELVFESQDPQRGWDGNAGGKPAPIGIYVYAARVTFYNDKTITRKGTISLIR